jgi:aldehyde:ferredoxin oxidoreductase
MNPSNEKYKPEMVVYGEHFCAITDSLGICKFSTVEEYSLFPEDLAPGITALWGEAITGEELLLIGERIVNLERLYNVREGLGREQDHLPRRFTEEPAPLYNYELDPVSGEMRRSKDPIRIGRIQDFESMLDRYYDLRGWSRDGVPTLQTLKRLGLEGYATGREAKTAGAGYG